MKYILAVILVTQMLFIGYLLYPRFAPIPKKPLEKQKEKPLLQYTYKNLRNYKPVDSNITVDENVFFFTTKGGKKVSGLINIPKEKRSLYPVVILIRGFVDPAIYETGIGSQRVGEYFASRGFVTLAPDFLGYGQSDKPSPDAFEDRFLTYTTVLDLLASIKNGVPGVPTDPTKIGIWAHSNGGQIALTIAEVTGHTHPTILWAPVTKPFPYSILYYTDEFDDNGKALRNVLAQFEQDYNVEDYSLTNYLDWINAPLQIHHGESDEEVPVAWSNEFVEKLKEKNKKIEYLTYPGTNHNFQSTNWQTAVERSVKFIEENLQ